MDPSRRRALALIAAGALAARLGPLSAQAPAGRPLTRPIPSSGEALPLVGLGSWITFNVGADPLLLDECARVMAAFFAGGGQLIDSSPMYGSSQATIGHGLRQLGHPAGLFSADKVWTGDAPAGPGQIDASRRAWDIARFDLVQVHNLVAWQAHLRTLLAMRDAGQVRYVGVTTSHGRRHADLAEILAREPVDFVQLTYNPLDREAEERLLPLARERGIAVIVNRPFQRGRLTRRLAREPLPGWAAEVGAASWAQVLLKFILAHPAVTCAIPATTRVDHVRENLAAAAEPLPDAAQARRIAAHLAQI